MTTAERDPALTAAGPSTEALAPSALRDTLTRIEQGGAGLAEVAPAAAALSLTAVAPGRVLVRWQLGEQGSNPLLDPGPPPRLRILSGGGGTPVSMPPLASLALTTPTGSRYLDLPLAGGACVAELTPGSAAPEVGAPAPGGLRSAVVQLPHAAPSTPLPTSSPARTAGFPTIRAAEVEPFRQPARRHRAGLEQVLPSRLPVTPAELIAPTDRDFTPSPLPLGEHGAGSPPAAVAVRQDRVRLEDLLLPRPGSSWGARPPPLALEAELQLHGRWTGTAELTLHGRPLACDADGRFTVRLPVERWDLPRCLSATLWRPGGE